MCETISLLNGTDIDTVRKFQDYFKVDATSNPYSVASTLNSKIILKLMRHCMGLMSKTNF